MASNSNGNSTSAASQAAMAKAKARLERLLDSSYAKIEELRQLLVKESNIRWKDCTKEIDPIMIRQRNLHETAIKRLSLGTDEGSNKLAGKYNGKSTQGQQKNVRYNPSISQAPKAALPHSYSLPSMGYPTLSMKEIPFDSISEIRREETAHMTKFNGSKDEKLMLPLQAKDDKQWYGSLDRNMVKKKKRGPVDKARRHTKIVGSMAALERTDELQPDEQYKIGLPSLARLDSLSLASHGLATKPRASPPPLVARIQSSVSPPPPPPPPKTNNLFSRGGATGKLPMIPDSDANHSVSRFQGILNLPSGVNSNPIGVVPDRTENKEMFSTIRGWLETDLDGPVCKPLTLSSEPTQASGFTVGYLDTTDSLTRPAMTSPATDISEKSSKSSESNEMRVFLNETIKPFEMADYYKYSTKYRQTQSTSQVADLSQSDLANGNSTLGNLSEDEFNANRNPDIVPKLPPRDLPMNARSNYKSGKLHSEKIQMVPVGSIDDSDLGWVMDTPTLV